MGYDHAKLTEFQTTVWAYYHAHGRRLRWREPEPDGSFDPYRILVSEIMLQQTQANRVMAKYPEFLRRFPSLAELAVAPLGDVLKEWSGLGYNRRAKYLWQTARHAQDHHQGKLPDTVEELVRFPGVGVNTAGAIIAYAFNKPAVYIETNIRTVFIHHFFGGEESIKDADILRLVELTLDKANPREWYAALMDYGVFLKGRYGNASRRSAGYTRQSRFVGSRRQIRGQVLKLLGIRQYSLAEMQVAIVDERLDGVVDELLREGLIAGSEGRFSLPAS